MAQGSNNNDAFLGSAMQFMQAGQNMAQQFMDYLGKASGNAAPVQLPPADPQALTALQKQFMDQQMSLWQAMLAKQQGGEQSFKVEPQPGDRRFAAPEWRESPLYDYIHQAYLLNTQYLNRIVELMPAQDEKGKDRLRFVARQVADAMAPCIDPAKSRYVGHANRREWWLFRNDAVAEACRGGNVPAPRKEVDAEAE